MFIRITIVFIRKRIVNPGIKAVSPLRSCHEMIRHSPGSQLSSNCKLYLFRKCRCAKRLRQIDSQMITISEGSGPTLFHRLCPACLGVKALRWTQITGTKRAMAQHDLLEHYPGVDHPDGQRVVSGAGD
jgi:hypothetical protein